MVSFHPIIPCEVLRKYVDRFLLYTGNVPGGYSQMLVPSNMQNIGFILKGCIRSEAILKASVSPKSYVFGQVTKPIYTNYPDHVVVFVVLFRSTGMYRLFGIPMQEFTNATIDLELILRPDEKCMIEQIFEAENDACRIGIIERFLIRRLTAGEHGFYSDRLEHASELMLRDGGCIPVRDLASEVNMTQRSLERHFMEEVGVSPKMFSGIARVRKAMQMIEKMPHITWKDITHLLQYTDQAHFIHEFKRFAGKTPTEYYSHTSDFEHYLYGE